MRDRSVGVMTLSFGAGVLGFYSQLAAVAMLLGGLKFFATGSPERALVLVLGVGFAALMIASYAAAFALWTGRGWSWNASLVSFGGCIVASVALALVTTNPMAALMPSLGAVAALWYMHTPVLRAQIGGATVRPLQVTIPTAETSRIVRGAR